MQPEPDEEVEDLDLAQLESGICPKCGEFFDREYFFCDNCGEFV